MMTDDEGAYMTGTVVLVTALAAALLDKGVLDDATLAKTMDSFAALISNVPMQVRPLEQCATLLAASNGPFGRRAMVDFEVLSEKLRRMSGSVGSD